jgi:hypothetical protein
MLGLSGESVAWFAFLLALVAVSALVFVAKQLSEFVKTNALAAAELVRVLHEDNMQTAHMLALSDTKTATVLKQTGDKVAGTLKATGDHVAGTLERTTDETAETLKEADESVTRKVRPVNGDEATG